MYSKLIKNDIKKNKLITITIAMFILLAALLTSLATSMIINLNSAIDNVMEDAKTPHFLQMHAGEIDMERLNKFIQKNENIAEYQVLDFLNISGEKIKTKDSSLVGNIQDNGLSSQSDKFDYLLDLNNNIIEPEDGQIYVPVFYMKENFVKVGDTIDIHGVKFTVAGFLRDSQMNSPMTSSKRFLVSENDLDKVRDHGKLEYLIEFRLHDTSKIASIESAYIEEGMESNGPPIITFSMFKLANAITDGLMIAVLILISVLVIIVTFLCIRFTLLAKVEEDYREIGVLKAIGLRVSDIKKLYTAKYGAIAALSCCLGFMLSLLFQQPLMENIRLFMGKSESQSLGIVFGILGSTLIFGVVILYVNGVLRRFKKISASQAIRFGNEQGKSKSSRGFLLSNNKIFSTNIFLGMKDMLSRKKVYITMLMVIIIASFIITVPQNLYNTISSKDFIRYMGIGNSHALLNLQPTDDMKEKTEEIADKISKDDAVSKYTVLTSRMFDLKMDDNTTKKIKVELGDHSKFPISYSKGRAPRNEDEIALSVLYAEDFEKNIGDKLNVVVDGKEKPLTVSGLYSDVSNGGKTAKASFVSEKNEILWSSIPILFTDSSITDMKVEEYKDQFSGTKVADTDEYMNQTFGSTIDAVKKVAYAGILTTVIIVILVTLLFMKMLVTRDRYPIAILKSLGFTNKNIRAQYVVRSLIVCVIGVIAGTVLANTLGEYFGSALISSFGVSTFRFDINPLFAYVFSPLLIGSCVYIATLLGSLGVKSVKISENIKE